MSFSAQAVRRFRLMKRCFENCWLVALLVVSFELVNQVSAQTFRILHSFTALAPNSFGYSTNADGATPYGSLVLSSNTLYGTAYVGGVALGGGGTVFAINTDGTGFTNLNSFNYGFPVAGLIISSNILYGTTLFDGSSGNGMVFAISTDGTFVTNLHSFSGGSDGRSPFGGLVLSSNALYGTTQDGGDSGLGTVFSVNTDGTGFTVLHSFSDTLAEGTQPLAGLTVSGETLYGVAAYEGIYTHGTLFKLNTDGTSFTVLYNFTGFGDGNQPSANLVLSGNVLYGTAAYGGISNNGTVFRVNTDGTGFKALYDFTPFNGDGANPFGPLVLSGKTLYGTTMNGGSSGYGTIYAIGIDGTGYSTLYSFTGGNGGATSRAGLLLSGNTLYGTTLGGGASGNGVVFSLSSVIKQPHLTILSYRSNIGLAWPTDAAGFTLQSTTNVLSGVWTTNLPAPAIVNGQYLVITSISGTQQFFRLSQ